MDHVAECVAQCAFFAVLSPLIADVYQAVVFLFPDIVAKEPRDLAPEGERLTCRKFELAIH
jgi:hypothetical protein